MYTYIQFHFATSLFYLLPDPVRRTRESALALASVATAIALTFYALYQPRLGFVPQNGQADRQKRRKNHSPHLQQIEQTDKFQQGFIVPDKNLTSVSLRCTSDKL